MMGRALSSKGRCVSDFTTLSKAENMNKIKNEQIWTWNSVFHEFVWSLGSQDDILPFSQCCFPLSFSTSFYVSFNKVLLDDEHDRSRLHLWMEVAKDHVSVKANQTKLEMKWESRCGGDINGNNSRRGEVSRLSLHTIGEVG